MTLAGRTGAGKSTIFRLILGLFAPWKGEVTVGGVSARYISDETKRHIFGYVEQTFRPVPGTVLDQLTLGDPAVTKEMAIRAASEGRTVLSISHRVYTSLGGKMIHI